MGAASSKNPQAMSNAKQIVDAALKSNRVFSKTYCPFCNKGKRALASVLPQEKITVMELDQRPDCSEIQDYLLEVTGGRSVPRVFIDGEFIGGGDETEQLARSGKLEVMLKEKGIA